MTCIKFYTLRPLKLVVVVEKENVAYLCVYDKLGYCKIKWLINVMLYIVILYMKNGR